ncbi:hypothetical protein ACQJBY_037774 [Aegilops geniculata]
MGSTKPLRLIQHKKEALWFYSFISFGYDHVFNPGQYTEDMRDISLEHARLHSRALKVVDVGGGTGFTTLGVVRYVDPENVTLLDQSPHQLDKARKKKALRGIKIMEGDAEDLPFPTDTFDRYVSAGRSVMDNLVSLDFTLTHTMIESSEFLFLDSMHGSIEYWPDPQRGIREAYRVLSADGVACMIGPVRPTFWLSRFFADMWMLFPTEEEYIEWFERAGFKDVELTRIGPKWYRGARRHGLVIGCCVTGIKTQSGDSPLQLGPKAEDVSKPHVNPIFVFFRFLIGTICATYFFLVPIYMWIKDKIVPQGKPI